MRLAGQFSISKPWRPVAWAILGTQLPATVSICFDRYFNRVYSNFFRGILFLVTVAVMWRVLRLHIHFRTRPTLVSLAGALGAACAGAILYKGTVGGVPRTVTPFELLITALDLIVLYPLGEELLFRGLVLAELKDRRPGVQVALSSALFLLVHLVYGLPFLTFLEFALIGTVLSWMAVRWGSLLPSLAMHSAFNAVMFFVFMASNPLPGSGG